MIYNLLYNFIFSDLCSWGPVSYENSSEAVDLSSNIPFHLYMQEQYYTICY